MNYARDLRARGFLCLVIGTLWLIIPGLPSDAQTFTVVHDFGATNDGAFPTGRLLLDSAGNIYGATSSGGTLGWGTIFEVDRRDQEHVLYNFEDRADGDIPSISYLGPDSILGTTYQGGLNLFGTVFKLNSNANLNVLYSCCVPGQNMGAFPASVFLNDDLSLYVLTYAGGDGPCYLTGCGTIFKLEQGGTATLVHAFGEDAGDGEFPNPTMVRDASGNLYGTTVNGGEGYGMIFKLAPGGNESILYSFRAGADGAIPSDGLFLDQNGNLYGATSHGGTYGFGTVFEVTNAGEHLILYNFAGSDGAQPIGGVILDPQGNVYGATSQGGSYNKGTIFKLNPTGELAVLHDFTGGSDGAFPESVLLAKDALYGVTYRGGTYKWGTLFRLSGSAGTGF